MSLQLDLY